MDLDQIAAYGTMLGALATFLSTVVALYLGLRRPTKSLLITTNFYEKTHILHGKFDPQLLILAHDLNDENSNKLVLGFNILNDSREAICIIGFIERAHFNWSPKTILKRALKLRRKQTASYTEHGYVSVCLRFGDWPYLFDQSITLKPYEQQLLCIDCDLIKFSQIDRVNSGLFNLKKPLEFFAVEANGRRYKVSSKVPAENFYIEKTCHLVKESWLD